MSNTINLNIYLVLAEIYKNMTFNYDLAFSRNIGWVTRDEQQIISNKKVGIAGLGGVGGNHLLTLVRMGFTRFNIADFDTFDIVNFNRQVGAMCSTLNKPKSNVLLDMALNINPMLEVISFDNGINELNIDMFLSNIDVCIDGLDFFAFNARTLLFSMCQKKGIPIITVAPLGFGASLMTFTPDSMSFSDYFGLDSCHSEEDMAIRFLTGLSPYLIHSNYLMDESAINLKEKKNPSSFASCQLCSGIMGTEALKIVLNRGSRLTAPYSLQFDSYLQVYHKTWRPWGYKNPLQQILFKMMKKRIEKRG